MFLHECVVFCGDSFQGIAFYFVRCNFLHERGRFALGRADFLGKRGFVGFQLLDGERFFLFLSCERGNASGDFGFLGVPAIDSCLEILKRSRLFCDLSRHIGEFGVLRFERGFEFGIF